jgi:hypothetical protein
MGPTAMRRAAQEPHPSVCSDHIAVPGRSAAVAMRRRSVARPPVALSVLRRARAAARGGHSLANHDAVDLAVHTRPRTTRDASTSFGVGRRPSLVGGGHRAVDLRCRHASGTDAGRTGSEPHGQEQHRTDGGRGSTDPPGLRRRGLPVPARHHRHRRARGAADRRLATDARGVRTLGDAGRRLANRRPPDRLNSQTPTLLPGQPKNNRRTTEERCSSQATGSRCPDKPVVRFSGLSRLDADGGVAGMRSALTHLQVRSLAVLPGALPPSPIRDERSRAPNLSNDAQDHLRRPARSKPGRIRRKLAARG